VDALADVKAADFRFVNAWPTRASLAADGLIA
jgi:hypothetical protein